jgi:hypothetical protein
MVYDVTLNQFSYWNGSSWVNVAGGGGVSSQWTTSGSNIYGPNGNVGINQTNPTAKLDVVGSFKYQPFGPSSPGVGKVLTSDAIGNATWDNPDVSSTTFTRNSGIILQKTPTDVLSFGMPAGIGSGSSSKLYLRTATEAQGFEHSDGTINLRTVVGNRSNGLSSTGGWLGTSSNHPLMLMVNDAYAMKIRPSGRFQIGYNNNTEPANERSMFDIADKFGTYPAPTLATFGTVQGTSLQANPAGIGFNMYNDASDGNNTKVISSGHAMRNVLNAGKLIWESHDLPNGGPTINIPAGSLNTVMSLEAGGGTYGNSSFPERLSVFTPTPTFATTLKYGFAHKQGGAVMGTRFAVDGTFAPTAGQIGTQSNHRLGFFTNNSTAEGITLATNNNVGINNMSPTAPLSFANVAGNKISLNNTSPTSQIGISSTASDMELYTSSSGNGKIFFGTRENSVLKSKMVFQNGLLTVTPGQNPAFPGDYSDTKVYGFVHKDIDSGSGKEMGTRIGYPSPFTASLPMGIGSRSNHPFSLFVNDGNPLVELYTDNSIALNGRTSVDGNLKIRNLITDFTGNGGVKIKSNASGTKMQIGTGTNQDLGLITNNQSKADVVLRTSGDITTTKQIWANKSIGGNSFNLVPLGIFETSGSFPQAIGFNDIFVGTSSIYGNVTSTDRYYETNLNDYFQADDWFRLYIPMNPSITADYNKIVITGNVNWNHTEEKVMMYRVSSGVENCPTGAFPNRKCAVLKFDGDNLDDFTFDGVFTLYGLGYLTEFGEDD